MSAIAMSDLLLAMLASGGPDRLDARDHRRVHEALIGYLSEPMAPKDRELLPALETTPDPEVGVRLRGVTKALWRLHALGFLAAKEYDDHAEFELVFHERSDVVDALSAEARNKLQRRAEFWSIASETDLKKRRQAA